MKQCIVDAFTEELFCGNPAAVCLVDAWPEDSLMQAIAQENALSETAFLLPEDSSYELRWFTPGGEIDLCGHATLASAFVADQMLHDTSQTLSFETASSRLDVTRRDGLYAMDFPAIPMTRTDVTPEMEHAFGATPLEAWLGEDLVCVFADEDAVRNLAPDQEALAQLPGLMRHATARAGASTASRGASARRLPSPRILSADAPIATSHPSGQQGSEDPLSVPSRHRGGAAPLRAVSQGNTSSSEAMPCFSAKARLRPNLHPPSCGRP